MVLRQMQALGVWFLCCVVTMYSVYAGWFFCALCSALSLLALLVSANFIIREFHKVQRRWVETKWHGRIEDSRLLKELWENQEIVNPVMHKKFCCSSLFYVNYKMCRLYHYGSFNWLLKRRKHLQWQNTNNMFMKTKRGKRRSNMKDAVITKTRIVKWLYGSRQWW
jgi:hypothetical protein